MASEQAGAEKGPAGSGEASEIVLSPPTVPLSVADTAHPSIGPGPVSASLTISSEALEAQGLHYLSHSQETKIHRGPLPDPATLRDLAEIYPNAPKVIFEEFRAQSNHRREMERSVVTANIQVMLRGQIIGGLIGGAGVVGSLIIAGMGHGWAGFGIATSSLVGLVSVFVGGRRSQEKERLEKAKMRNAISRREPIEELVDGLHASPSDSAISPRKEGSTSSAERIDGEGE